jgi:hypothetical protein
MAEPPEGAPPKAASGLKATLTRKVGPFPLWAYGAIAIVGVLALRLFAARSATKTSSSGAFAPGPGGPSSPGSDLLPTPPDAPAPIVVAPPPGETVPVPPLAIAAPAIPTMLGKSAAMLAREPAGGWKVPPLFQQVSPTAVIDSTANGRVNPKNVLLGFSDATGTLFSEPGPGRTAIWK